MVKTLPLRSSVNKGIILMSTNSAGNNFIIYDTKGTLNTRQDDDLTIMRGILDQDGGVVSTYGINTLFEDEDSGTVWVGCQYGLFFFQPRTTAPLWPTICSTASTSHISPLTALSANGSALKVAALWSPRPTAAPSSAS